MADKVKRTIYDIDADILALINEETGEVADFDSFEALQIERNTKIENACMLVLDLRAQAEAIEARAKEMEARAKRLKSQSDRVESFVDSVLAGEKFHTENVDVKYTQSSKVELTIPEEEFVLRMMDHNPDFLRIQLKREPDRVKIGKAIKDGVEVYGASVVSRKKISIK